MKSTAEAFGQGLLHAWQWQKGDVLTLFSLNDVDVGPCTYGVLYAGGVVSPANPAYNAEELAFMLRDAGSKALATQKELLSIAIDAANLVNLPLNRIVLLGEGKDEKTSVQHFKSIRKSAGGTLNKRPKLNPDVDLSFLAYSSGTTGLPKGVMLSHTNIVSDVLMITGSVGSYYNWKNDKLLGVLPFFHIYGRL